MRTISITEFRRTCLQLVDRLPSGGMAITKRGRVIATIAPARVDPRSYIGSIPDLIVDAADTLYSTGLRWEANGNVKATKATRGRRGA